MASLLWPWVHLDGYRWTVRQLTNGVEVELTEGILNCSDTRPVDGRCLESRVFHVHVEGIWQ